LTGITWNAALLPLLCLALLERWKDGNRVLKREIESQRCYLLFLVCYSGPLITWIPVMKTDASVTFPLPRGESEGGQGTTSKALKIHYRYSSHPYQIYSFASAFAETTFVLCSLVRRCLNYLIMWLSRHAARFQPAKKKSKQVGGGWGRRPDQHQHYLRASNRYPLRGSVLPRKAPGSPARKKKSCSSSQRRNKKTSLGPAPVQGKPGHLPT
jgi:hypothetical protein